MRLDLGLQRLHARFEHGALELFGFGPVASSAVSSALRLPPATALMMKEATMSAKTGLGCLNMPPRIRASNETSSNFFHDTAASQSKKRHHITTMPSRISCRLCLVPDGRRARPLLPRSAVSSVPGMGWWAFILVPSGRLLVTGQDYGSGPLGSSAARQNARR
jgi:hypothetical protein